jgi:restriction system protein
MKFRMHENSLFAILLRKPWWVSALIAAALIALARVALPPTWFIYGASASLPFVVIAGIAGWRRLKAPSDGRVADTVAAVRAMAWPAFADALEGGFKREGWTVTRVEDPAADFQLEQGWRRGIVGARRWKAARTGIEPLRDLQAARERREVHDAVFVVVGELSEQAVRFAQAHRIRLVQGPELAALLPAPRRGGPGGLRRSPG